MDYNEIVALAVEGNSLRAEGNRLTSTAQVAACVLVAGEHKRGGKSAAQSMLDKMSAEKDADKKSVFGWASVAKKSGIVPLYVAVGYALNDSDATNEDVQKSAKGLLSYATGVHNAAYVKSDGTVVTPADLAPVVAPFQKAGVGVGEIETALESAFTPATVAVKALHRLKSTKLEDESLVVPAALLEEARAIMAKIEAANV